MDNAYRVIVVAVCAGLVSDAYVVGPIFGVAILLAAPVVVGLFVGLLGCEAPVGEYTGSARSGNLARLIAPTANPRLVEPELPLSTEGE
ncbi:hypothetical protein PKCBPO_00802 [Methylorubrum thiocyanatum]